MSVQQSQNGFVPAFQYGGSNFPNYQSPSPDYYSNFVKRFYDDENGDGGFFNNEIDQSPISHRGSTRGLQNVKNKQLLQNGHDQGYLDYFETNGNGFIDPSDGNDIYIGPQTPNSNQAGSAYGAEPTGLRDNFQKAGAKFGPTGNGLGNNAMQYPLDPSGFRGSSQAQGKGGYPFRSQQQGYNYGNHGSGSGQGYAGSYNVNRRQDFGGGGFGSSPCAKGPVNIILMLATLAGLIYAGYQAFNRAVGGNDRKRKRSGDAGGLEDLVYGPLVYGKCLICRSKNDVISCSNSMLE